MKCHVEKRKFPESNPILFDQPLYLLLNASWQISKIKICDDLLKLMEAHKSCCSNNHFTILKKEKGEEVSDNESNINESHFADNSENSSDSNLHP